MALPVAVEDALRRAGAGASAAREDGWSNFLTGLGTSRDKRSGGTFNTTPVPDAEARDLWRGDDLAAHAIETYPDEMLRAGYEVCIAPKDSEDEVQADAARELSDRVDAALVELKADEAFRTALCYERAYGGSAIFPVLNDGTPDLSLPLNETRIMDRVRSLVVLEPQEMRPAEWYDDMIADGDKYGTPRVWWITPIAVQGAAQRQFLLHESRLIYFPGIRVSKRPGGGAKLGHGDSVITRINDTLRDFNLGFGSASHLLNDVSQAVMSIRGLKAALATPGGEEILKRRMVAMDMARSALRMLLVDAGENGEAPETFKREPTPMAGIPDMLDRLTDRLAAALEEPASRFMKQAPGGLNPGDSETRWFYDRVSQKQDKHLRPRANRMIELIMLSKGGPTAGQVPAKWHIDFCPLWQPSQAEELATRKLQAEVDQIYCGLGVLSPDGVAQDRFGGPGYSYETSYDPNALAEHDAATERAAAEQQKVAPTTTPSAGAAEAVPAVKQDANEFALGDRVRVRPGKAHAGMGVGEIGTVAIVEQGVAFGIKFPDMAEIHKWYVGSELEPA